MRDDCSTRYPVVLHHGLGYRDDLFSVSSWGRIPSRLRAAGCSVLVGTHEPCAPIERNAERLCDQVSALIVKTGARKVNLIAHSKGGLEARYAVSRLGLGGWVASVTTVCTPHHGTCIADVATAQIPSSILHQGGALGFLAKLVGNRDPGSIACLGELTSSSLKSFNREVTDSPGVYYQSFGTTMRRPEDDPLLVLGYELLRRHAGDNDGLVSTDSCRWGNFRGLIPTGDTGGGISHLEITDFRQQDGVGGNIPGFYVDIVRDLKERGY
jgi:triacylglycerol lipase